MRAAPMGESEQRRIWWARCPTLLREHDAALSQIERLRDDITHTIAFLEATNIPGCRAMATQLRQQLGGSSYESSPTERSEE